MVNDPDQTFYTLKDLQICRPKFLDYTKLACHPILRLPSWEMFGQGRGAAVFNGKKVYVNTLSVNVSAGTLWSRVFCLFILTPRP